MLTLSNARILTNMPDDIHIALLHTNPNDETRPLLEDMDLDVYIIDAPYMKDIDAYGVIRGTRFPLMYKVHPMTASVIERRMKEVYPLYGDDQITDTTLLNGIRDMDEHIIDFCMKNPMIQCKETDYGEITYGSHTWDGEMDFEEWMKPFLVPLVTDLEDGQGILQAMVMFPRQLILFNKFNASYLEKIASHVREHVALFSGPTNHTLMDRYNVTGTSAVLIYYEHESFKHDVLDGEITLESIKDFVARI